MRELSPEAIAEIDALDAYAAPPAAGERPAVRLNMIVSVDGGTSWGGVSGALGGPADKALFAVLRSFADIVLVAAGPRRGGNLRPGGLPPAIQESPPAPGRKPPRPSPVVCPSSPARSLTPA